MRNHKAQNYIYGETLGRDAPRPAAAVYEILSQHLATGANNPETHMALNDVYKALGSTEQAAVTALDGLEQRGTINREDSLILTVLLAVSKTRGTNLDFLRQGIISGNFNPEEMNTAFLKSGLDSKIIEYIQKITQKLKT